MNSLLGKSLNAARIHQKSAMMCSWSGFGSVGWVIMDGWRDLRFFVSRSSRVAALGSPCLHFLCFHANVGILGIGMGLGCMEIGFVMGVLLQILNVFCWKGDF